ncbi:spore coat protein YutH [Bacillus sp. 31A1R]|uniref:Spore coat protein YutH n=1 Tax=Robertmurraya mangrovi TaxID=3098077 RepID=A0ABU5IYC2_9BACI|nr:spore coat protein YutH [Bacillus sp. 31A1R]MDZ5472122.1 spore coat protein YutH [Bacillus sp. 31A1R]
MLQELLQKKYGIKVADEFRIESYEACKTDQELYLLVPIGGMEREDLFELEQMVNHLIQYGDRHVSQFKKTEEGEPVIEWKDGRYIVLVNKSFDSPTNRNIGRKLSKFHYRGRLLNVRMNRLSRIGQWKVLWEKRLDQMEKVWTDLLQKETETEFDRMFLESFPYYMGLTENAIQYLTDTEFDDEPAPVDSGTVCHVRFGSHSWGKQYFVKNPFDWVFDHCSRDLAEWTRERYFRNIQTYEPDVKHFLADYQSVIRLSPFSWRLLYARLMFPLHFFDCVENYYITNSEQQRYTLQDQFQKYLDQTREHEKFLGNFYQLAEVPVRSFGIPELEWLKK